MYSGNTAFTPGSGPPPYAAATSLYAANSAQPYEWYAAPGPNRRGNMCITHTDSLRGYGFQAPCEKSERRLRVTLSLALMRGFFFAGR